MPKLPQVPVIVLSHLSDAQKRAYILADNRLALDAGWDDEDNVTLIRVVAGICFVIVLVVLIQRRRKRVK